MAFGFVPINGQRFPSGVIDSISWTGTTATTDTLSILDGADTGKTLFKETGNTVSTPINPNFPNGLSCPNGFVVQFNIGTLSITIR